MFTPQCVICNRTLYVAGNCGGGCLMWGIEWSGCCCLYPGWPLEGALVPDISPCNVQMDRSRWRYEYVYVKTPSKPPPPVFAVHYLPHVSDIGLYSICIAEAGFKDCTIEMYGYYPTEQTYCMLRLPWMQSPLTQEHFLQISITL